ncbi:MAG: 5'/3'-nucleotidase SurE [Rhodospirillaceae bacterium]|jgi:5'-nucleotidase|nr:5'/3'-nucleotidase SurE [Rhodospirillaceae bacterium]MBT6137611.1 5'/3'-nucleotidase SurE [Rhodospirillaceae bacterium]
MTSGQRRFGRILVTNDDGIDAPGLAVAIEVAEALADEVWVSAPAGECSGMSRQVSINQPLRLIERGERRFAVTGSPADSVIVGLRHLMNGHTPDLVLSGVNAGANISKEIGYSGTVGAALTARMLGVPAVALSQAWITRKNIPWDTSRHWLPGVITQLADGGDWPQDAIHNINIPNAAVDEVTGVEITRQGTGLKLDIAVDQRTDHRENDYFWINFKREQGEELEDADVAALRRNAISVTPVGIDLTDHGLRSALTSIHN